MKTLLLLLLLSIPALSQDRDNTAFALGNPAAGDTTLLLLPKPTYTVSYSHARNSAALVAWHLGKEDFGTASRYPGPFYPDVDLPKSWYHARQVDYERTGYDRGHLLCSADRRANAIEQKSTFVLSNVIPQTPNLNRISWEHLEQYTRDQVNAGKEAYIVAGGSGSLGTLPHAPITIPEFCWKVILLLPEGNNDLSRVCDDDIGVEIIAVLMPNTSDVSNLGWESYKVPVSQIEALTGYTFWPDVTENVRLVLAER